jgi:hypothetical protein
MSIYGYYDSPSQIRPVFDPGTRGVPCPNCGNELNEVDLRTISLMVPNDSRSYFYRVHKSCHESLNERQQTNLDSLLIDAICSQKNRN